MDLVGTTLKQIDQLRAQFDEAKTDADRAYIASQAMTGWTVIRTYSLALMGIDASSSNQPTEETTK